MQEKIISAEHERIQKEKQLQQEERLAKELERLKWEQQRDERMRQQIKENRYGYMYNYALIGFYFKANVCSWMGRGYREVAREGKSR